jgi:hypothetical protein
VAERSKKRVCGQLTCWNCGFKSRGKAWMFVHLCNPEVHHRTHKSLPPIPTLSQIDRGFFKYFVTWLFLYGEELSPPSPTPKLKDHPLSAVSDCLFNTFAVTLHMWRWWQGPTYHGHGLCFLFTFVLWNLLSENRKSSRPQGDRMQGISPYNAYWRCVLTKQCYFTGNVMQTMRFVQTVRRVSFTMY